MNRFMYTAAVLQAFVFLAGCAEDSLVTASGSGIPAIEGLSLPDTVWTGSVYDIELTVQVSDNGFSDSVTIAGEMRSDEIPGFTVAFSFFDDGSHGDNIPGDRIFSAAVPSSVFEGITGSASLAITGSAGAGGPSIEPITRTLTIVGGVRNMPPSLRGLSMPDSVRYDMSDQTVVTVTATDENGLNDILEVTGLLFAEYSPKPDLVVTFRDTSAASGSAADEAVFTAVIDHGDIARIGPGNYTLLVSARDRAGFRSEELIAAAYFNRGVFESPPLIVSVSAPDSIRADGSLIFIQVEVFDENGLNDITGVYFLSLKPDGSFANNGNPIPLFDDGGFGSGDLTAGDGIYSVTFPISPGTDKGTFTFKFQAVDTAGLTSAFYNHPLVVF